MRRIYDITRRVPLSRHVQRQIGRYSQTLGTLEFLLDRFDECSGVEAIDDAMIEGRGQVHYLTDDDFTIHSDWPFGDAVDTNDRYLGRIDQRRRGDTSQCSKAGDGDGRA